MEIKNPQSTKPSQEVVCINNIGDFGQDGRSYTCTFCNRGFSNAQALGGHMNVHRKDRARLQESIQEETLDTRKGIDHLAVESSDDEKGEGVSKRPWEFTEESQRRPKKKDYGVNFEKPTLELSLCIEQPSTGDSCIRSNNISSPSSSPTEVDLELRLGMDSDHQTTSRV